MSDYQLYIDGEWTEAAAGESYDTFNPGTGEKIASIAQGGTEDVDRAVAAARRAFDEGPWPKMSGKERADVLRAIAEKLTEKGQHLAEVEARDGGGTIKKGMLADVTTTAGTFMAMANFAETQPEYEELPPVVLGPTPSENYIQYEPIGVCAGITPWNFPLAMASWKIAPAIAAGNCVVLKPASITSLTALEVAKVIDEVGVPAGVVNVIAGPGRTVGEALAQHSGVDKVAFTGSTEVGARIMALAAPSIKKVTLELGGKSAAIVTDDVNLDLAVAGVLWGTFWHNGQVCQSGTRALVDEKVYDEFIDKAVEKAASIKLGDQMDFMTDQGPVVSQQQIDTIEGYVQSGQDEGAKLVCGGRRPEGEQFDNGYFYEPTIFADVDNSMKIAQEEIFGPVLSVIKTSSDDDAVKIANDSIYGLAGAVWCRDIERAKGLAESMRTGTVWINEHHLLTPEHPFGGYKQSGIGRELGPQGFNEYRELKRIHVDESGDDPAGHLTFSMLFSA